MMSNVEFSPNSQAILQNKKLADYIVHRMANLTPEEENEGKIDVDLGNGNVLEVRFGPSVRSDGTVPTPSKKKRFSMAAIL